MYPKEFTEWVGDKNYFRVPSTGIWYHWPDPEIMEVPIADNTDKLYEIWKEETQKQNEKPQ